MAPLLIASVESPAMVGPVTAYPQAVMVSCPSFSVNVMRLIKLSTRLTEL